MAFQKGARRRGGGGGGGVRLTPREMANFGLETVFSSSSSYVQIKRTKSAKCKKRTEEKKTKKRTTTTGVGPRSECSTHNTFKLLCQEEEHKQKKTYKKCLRALEKKEQKKKKKKVENTHTNTGGRGLLPFVRRCFG